MEVLWALSMYYMPTWPSAQKPKRCSYKDPLGMLESLDVRVLGDWVSFPSHNVFGLGLSAWDVSYLYQTLNPNPSEP